MSYLIPVEAYILKFDAPEQALFYMDLNKKIIKIIDDINGSFVISGDVGENIKFNYFPKSNNEWSIPKSLFNSKIKSRFFSKGGITSILDKSSNRMLVVIQTTDYFKTNFSIIDSIDSEYKFFSKKYLYSDSKVMFYYTIIDGDTENYWIDINGEKIELS